MKVLTDMLWPIPLIGIAAALAFGAKFFATEYCRRENDPKDFRCNDGWIAGAIACSIMAGVLGVIGVIGFFVCDLSALNWSILLDYRIGLAAKVLNLI